jgi:PhzF family phenazine biosynthesis protein
VPRSFRQVDVFTTEAYQGNPVAVVMDGVGPPDETLQRFANWMNLSETTFVLPPTTPEADYRVRIFTPTLELPFAGHPTLGTCHAWLEDGGVPHAEGVVVQECAAGLIRVRRDPDGLAFAAPPLVRSGPVEERLVEEIAAVLGVGREEILDSQWVDNGPGWVAVMLRDAEAVLAVRPAASDMFVGVVGAYPEGAEAAFEVRAFFPVPGGSGEDPVTGSLNASLAAWLLATGRAEAPYTASQGTALGRRGRVRVCTDDDGTIWIGGGTVTCLTGEVAL